MSGWTPPEIFDEYRLLRPIGQGGMGQVYLGQDLLLDRTVAVKFISAVEPDAHSRQRFLTEARAIARLQHPNVVSIYRVGEVDGRPFLVSELVHGKSLSRLLGVGTPRPMPWERVLHIGLGLSRGLAAAHRQGVLHRDLKPSNVMLTADDEVKLLDFGLAKLLGALPDEGLGAWDPRAQADLAIPSASARDNSGDLPTVPCIGPALPPMMPPMIMPAPKESEGPLTRAGAILGTPLYMAPETLRGEPATQRSDVYSLGMILYELCAGASPRLTSSNTSLATGHGKTATASVEENVPPLLRTAPDVAPALAQVVDRCLHSDPARRFASGDEVRDALERLGPELRAPAIPGGNPYRGLLSFEAEHRGLFFGRDPEVRAVLERLRTEPMVLVAGDSGVGKSSLCRAGLLPAVAEGALSGGGGRSFTVLRLSPGRRPLSALAASLLSLFAPLSEEEIGERLRRDPPILGRMLRQHLSKDHGVLLFVDQLEELITVSDPAEAALCARLLADLAVPTPSIRVLLCARGDFLTWLAVLPGLGDEILRALYLLRPLLPDGIREAIVGPARRKGVEFESEALVNTLVDSTTRAAGGLPLLQFALLSLWEARDRERGCISAQALFQMGGVVGALSHHADGVLDEMTGPQRAAARRALVRLVNLDGPTGIGGNKGLGGIAGTRVRRTAEELGGTGDGAGAMQAALELLVRGRLVVVRQADGAALYELAHEALVSGWETLRTWLDANLEARGARFRVEVAAAEWERLGRSSEALWSGRRLRETERLADMYGLEAAFLVASLHAVRQRRWSRALILLTGPLVLLVFFVGARLNQRRELDRLIAARLGQAQAALSMAREQGSAALSLRQRAFQRFDQIPSRAQPGGFPLADGPGARLALAEREYSAAREKDRGAEAAYLTASQELESALSLDPDRRVVRRLLGDVTFERILLEERLEPTRPPTELLQRLAYFDDDRSRRRRLAAPCHLRLDVVNRPDRVLAQVPVQVQRFEREAGERGDLAVSGDRHLVFVNRLPAAVGADLRLAPGSYLLTFILPEAQVRLPLLCARGEERRLDLDLPSRVPEGYVYVPAGSFLFGSAEDEDLRRGFLNAPPLHAVSTPAYLIGRYEVTFGDWLVYLRALSPAQRKPRLPRAGEFHGGGVALAELADGLFQLTLQPTAQLLKAREGEPLRYPGRTRRAVQDWQRLPVSGISFEDAEAYATWLDRSGRLPGARLCDEHEWERAARGADDRRFPHGDRLTADDANFDETYDRDPLSFGPDEVGSHPRSASPFGVQDLSGNVFEWTRSARASTDAVLRGGSWYHNRMTVRVNNREPGEPKTRNVLIGTRVCASVPVRPQAAMVP